MSRIARLWLTAMAAGLAMASPAGAADPHTVVFVLDGSGSMWANLEGERRNKLAQSRDAILTSLASTTRDARIGLVSFGHRRGDCNDVEVMVRPESGSGVRIAGALEKHKPSGRGPITLALREAARQLPPAPADATVVLIHDDGDNCQLDPCSAVADLREQNPGTVVHVVSLGARREENLRLSCLPNATGGKHYETVTGVQLIAAVEDAMRTTHGRVAAPFVALAEPAPPKREAAPAPATEAAKPGLQLTALLTDGGAPVASPVRWRVVRRTGTGTTTTAVWEGDAVAPLLELPTGAYQIEAWLGFVKTSSAIDVVHGRPQVLAVVLRAGVLRLPAPARDAPPELLAALADVVVSVKRIDAEAETMAFQRGLVPEITLAPGTYVVALTSGSGRHERTLSIRAGQLWAFDQGLTFGAIELSAVVATGGQKVDRALLSVFQDDPDAPQGRREIWRSAASPATVALPAGSYHAVARRGGAEKRERFTIKSGLVEKRTLALDTGRIEVATKVVGSGMDSPDPVSTRLERLDGDKAVAVSSEQPAVFELPAGRYRVDSRIGSGNAAASREIELKAGGREPVTLELTAGHLRLRLLDGSGQPLTDVAWDIRDGTGRAVWSASQTEARPLLLAGRYTVRAEARDRRAEEPVEVRPGETRSVDLTAR